MSTTARKANDVQLAEYRDRNGTKHRVCGRRDTRKQQWLVVDRVGRTAIVVEALSHPDDDAAQVEAVAKDYAEQMQLHHNGERDLPLPNAEEVPTDRPEKARTNRPQSGRAAPARELVAA